MKNANTTPPDMVTLAKTINFLGYECLVELSRYRDNHRPAIALITRDGMPLCTASVNVPEVPLKKNEVLIKDYSENAGVLKALVDAGIVEYTGTCAPIGHARIPIARLTEGIMQEMASVH